MRTSVPRLALLLGVVLFAGPIASASAQNIGPVADPPAAHPRSSAPVFRSTADLVVLPVTVTDSRQKYVSGLTMEDFHVYEDGVSQDLALFAADSLPLDLAILLDTSSSMSNRMPVAQEAAIGFVRTLRAGDRAEVIEFNDAARVRQPLSEDLARVESAIRETTAGGGTALQTALYIALKDLARQNPTGGDVRRQAIVLLSDGEDTRSIVSSDEVLELVRRSGVVIYTISPKSDPADIATSNTRSWYASQSDYLMRTFAEETGGRAFFPLDIRELVPLYGVIAEELRNQYTLGYRSTNPKQDGAFRRIQVRVPSQPGARPRTRPGYLALRASQHAGQRPARVLAE